jgi:hypothetical protein
MEIENKLFKQKKIISKLNVEKSKLKKYALSQVLRNKKKD